MRSADRCPIDVTLCSSDQPPRRHHITSAGLPTRLRFRSCTPSPEFRFAASTLSYEISPAASGSLASASVTAVLSGQHARAAAAPAPRGDYGAAVAAAHVRCASARNWRKVGRRIRGGLEIEGIVERGARVCELLLRVVSLRWVRSWKRTLAPGSGRQTFGTGKWSHDPSFVTRLIRT